MSGKYEISKDRPLAINLRTGRQDDSHPHLVIELLYTVIPPVRNGLQSYAHPMEGFKGRLMNFRSRLPRQITLLNWLSIRSEKQASGFQSGTLYKGGRFYVKTSMGFALVDFRMVPGNKSLRLTSYLNPDACSRNLEFDAQRAP